MSSYYGRPIVKEPVWKPEIPWYFFFGGMAGGSALLRVAARLAGNETLGRRALAVNTAAIAISPVLLIRDLGRPRRFLNMLRVFKVTSPMSVGTWIVAASGVATGTSAALEVAGILPRVKVAAETAAGALGPFLSTYTAVLVSDTVVPVWHEARRELPLVFAGSSAAAAGGAAALMTPVASAGPGRRLAVGGGLLELAATRAMQNRLGPFLAEPYRKGTGGDYARASRAATVAGTGLMALAGRRRLGAAAGGALLLAGSILQRFAIVHAGKESARDPKYTVGRY